MSVPPDRSSHRSRLLTRDCSRTRAAVALAFRRRQCSPRPPDPPLRRKPMTPHRHAPASVGLALLGALSLAPAAGAQIAVSANDNKVVSLNGVVTVVPNAPPDTVSVFTIQGKTVSAAGAVEVGGVKAGGGQVVIAPDGKTALVSRRDDNRISVLSIDGTKVEYTKRDMTAGVRPIVLDIASSGAFAMVASLAGSATGDNDSVSLIDLTAKP